MRRRSFGLYVTSQKQGEEEWLRSPCGLLHNSLGSQLALHILGQEREWRTQGGLYLRQLASVEAAKQALNNGRVQAVLWEKHQAYEYASVGEWVQIWEASSGFPKWMRLGSCRSSIYIYMLGY